MGSCHSCFKCNRPEGEDDDEKKRKAERGAREKKNIGKKKK